jgi:hypothetical protein
MKQKSNEFNTLHVPGAGSFHNSHMVRRGIQKRFPKTSPLATEHKLNYTNTKGGGPPYGKLQQDTAPPIKYGDRLPCNVCRLMSNANQVLWAMIKDYPQKKPEYGQQYGNSNIVKANSLPSLVSAKASCPTGLTQIDKPVTPGKEINTALLLLSAALSRLLREQAVNVRKFQHSRPIRCILASPQYVYRLKEGGTPYREISTINDSTAERVRHCR